MQKLFYNLQTDSDNNTITSVDLFAGFSVVELRLGV